MLIAEGDFICGMHLVCVRGIHFKGGMVLILTGSSWHRVSSGMQLLCSLDCSYLLKSHIPKRLNVTMIRCAYSGLVFPTKHPRARWGGHGSGRTGGMCRISLMGPRSRQESLY